MMPVIDVSHSIQSQYSDAFYNQLFMLMIRAFELGIMCKETDWSLNNGIYFVSWSMISILKQLL